MPIVGLGLALLLAVGILAGNLNLVNDARPRIEAENAIRDVLELRRNVGDAYAGRANYAGLSIARADVMGILPASLDRQAGPRGTTVSLSPAGSGGAQFEVVLGSINRFPPLCYGLVSRTADRWMALSIDGVDVSASSPRQQLSACERGSQLRLRSY